MGATDGQRIVEIHVGEKTFRVPVGADYGRYTEAELHQMIAFLLRRTEGMAADDAARLAYEDAVSRAWESEKWRRARPTAEQRAREVKAGKAPRGTATCDHPTQEELNAADAEMRAEGWTPDLQPLTAAELVQRIAGGF